MHKSQRRAHRNLAAMPRCHTRRTGMPASSCLCEDPAKMTISKMAFASRDCGPLPAPGAFATCTQASVRAARRYRVRCACLPLPASVRLQRHQQAAARLPIARRAERRPFSSLEGFMQVLKAVGERIVESRIETSSSASERRKVPKIEVARIAVFFAKRRSARRETSIGDLPGSLHRFFT